jgi:hypothetical protein
MSHPSNDDVEPALRCVAERSALAQATRRRFQKAWTQDCRHCVVTRRFRVPAKEFEFSELVPKSASKERKPVRQ